MKIKTLIALIAILVTTAADAQTLNITGTLNGLPGGNYGVSGTATLQPNGGYTVTGTLTAVCTEIIAPSTSTLTDMAGNVWSFGPAYPAPFSNDFQVFRNGSWFALGGGVTLALAGGQLYAHTAEGAWWMAGSLGWTATTQPGGCQ